MAIFDTAVKELKRTISRLTDKPVYIGMGVSMDPVKVAKPIKNKAIFILKGTDKQFMFLRVNSGKVTNKLYYILENLEDQTELTLTKDLFDEIFECKK